MTDEEMIEGGYCTWCMGNGCEMCNGTGDHRGGESDDE